MLPPTTALPAFPVTAKSSEISAELTSPRVAARAWSREQFARDLAPLLPSVFRLCLALSDNTSGAEDLLQSALVRAYVHRDSFRGEGAMLAWLCTIVRNEQADLVRQTARRRGLVRAAIEHFGELFEDWSRPPELEPELKLSIAQDSESVLAALRELPEAYRTAVWMCDVEQLSYQAASEVLGIPVGTVKSRHARGRAKLRAGLARRRAQEEA